MRRALIRAVEKQAGLADRLDSLRLLSYPKPLTLNPETIKTVSSVSEVACLCCWMPRLLLPLTLTAILHLISLDVALG